MRTLVIAHAALTTERCLANGFSVCIDPIFGPGFGTKTDLVRARAARGGL